MHEYVCIVQIQIYSLSTQISICLHLCCVFKKGLIDRILSYQTDIFILIIFHITLISLLVELLLKHEFMKCYFSSSCIYRLSYVCKLLYVTIVIDASIWYYYIHYGIYAAICICIVQIYSLSTQTSICLHLCCVLKNG